MTAAHAIYDPLNAVVQALRDHGCSVLPAGRDRYEAQCPAHDDRDPSLSVGRGSKGEPKAVVHCHAGCGVADILEAVEVMGPRFVQIYGQGETPMVGTALSRARIADASHPRYLQRLASVGVAQTPVELRVADAQGRSLPPDEPGEVLVRGDSVMAGYWRNPDATAAAIRDGWLWTGDIGSLDADGFLTLKDRSKDLLISGGSNIYPREVEEVLLTFDGVADLFADAAGDSVPSVAVAPVDLVATIVDLEVLHGPAARIGQLHRRLARLPGVAGRLAIVIVGKHGAGGQKGCKSKCCQCGFHGRVSFRLLRPVWSVGLRAS